MVGQCAVRGEFGDTAVDTFRHSRCFMGGVMACGPLPEAVATQISSVAAGVLPEETATLILIFVGAATPASRGGPVPTAGPTATATSPPAETAESAVGDSGEFHFATVAVLLEPAPRSQP
ncbi:MAG: hypothetical protein CEE40_12625 [Chloroflexi bacterium B3_Chlor]|nr:MAG: hypothetical protein CEE40_12625 [Chloroflexi bacterium B3_Chlor]